MFIGPGQLHSFEKTEGVKGLVISFPEDFLLTSNDQGNVINFRFLYILSSKNILTSNLKDGQAIERLCEVLYSESRNSFDQFQHHILQNTLFSLIYLLMRSYSETKNMNQPNDKYYNLAVHFKLTLVEYIAQNSSLQFYLDKLDVSQSTLQIATKKVFNKTPKALLDESLILRAKRMLADPCKRIQEISFDLGFSEHTNFTKFFKRHTGHTPDSYRNMIISSNK